MTETFITFIIPTIGRETLKKSIESLLYQTDNDWNAIIIFDGIKKNIDIIDKRIKIIEINKIGNIDIKNNGGFVRNIGIKNVENSLWIGFLDDDDYLSENYILNLKNEISIHNNLEICIFRMAYENGYVLPTKNDKNINRYKVGISFAIKKYVGDHILFENNPFEDYLFLKNAQNKKYKIIISSYVTYFVRSLPKNYELYPKILINF
jgi:hypothetical protein